MRKPAIAAIFLSLTVPFAALAAPAPPTEARLDHVGFRVADIDRSIKFYTEQLGLELIRRGDYDLTGSKVDPKDAAITAAFVKRPGMSALELIQFRKPMPGMAAQGGAGFHLGVSVPDVRGTWRRLVDAGAKSTGEPRLRDGIYTASVQDPDGVTLELMETTSDAPSN